MIEIGKTPWEGLYYARLIKGNLTAYFGSYRDACTFGEAILMRAFRNG